MGLCTLAIAGVGQEIITVLKAICKCGGTRGIRIELSDRKLIGCWADIIAIAHEGSTGRQTVGEVLGKHGAVGTRT